jgi:predicted ABC-type ATPase
MAVRKARVPKCIVIAGPNGAGKTTFAREFLPHDRGILNFVNADLIAAGLSPLRPPLAARAAGRLVLAELDRLVGEREDFGFESTLSGRGYVERLRHWKSLGYHVEIVFLRLSSPRLALKRISMRVAQGGHDVPRADVIRRFTRGRENFEKLYQPFADSWAMYNNSGSNPVLEAKYP